MNRQVILVEGSRARCAVEMSAEPSAAEEMAGEELVHYLGKLGGVSIGLHRGDEERCACADSGGVPRPGGSGRPAGGRGAG